MDPTLAPTTRSIGTPALPSTSMTPAWAQPRIPPAPRTRPTFGVVLCVNVLASVVISILSRKPRVCGITLVLEDSVTREQSGSAVGTAGANDAPFPCRHTPLDGLIRN